MTDQYYNNIRNAIANKVSQGEDPEDVVWALIEGVAAVVDGASGGMVGGLVSGGLQTVSDAVKHNKGGGGLVPNPWFVFNQHDDQESPYTKKYLRNRGRKNLASGIIGIGGTVSSQVTQADMAGIVQHSNATGSTVAHLYKLKGQAQNFKQSETLTKWIDLLIQMKTVKTAVRGTQLAGSAIPVGALQAATGLGAAAAKLGIKLHYTNLCLITSADVHWRAFQEQAISGGLLGKRGKVGPASNMLYELFTRRGFTRVFGKYDVDKIIRAPAGWMAVSDKLLLI